MRKMLSVLAILVGSLGVFGIAGAAPASAANCQFGYTEVVYTGVWQWNATALNCTGVNAVQFQDAASTTCCYLVDETHGNTVHFSYAGGGVAYSPGYPAAGSGTYYATYYNNIWGSGCGAPHFYVRRHYQVRIHNTAGAGSWGSFANISQGIASEIC